VLLRAAAELRRRAPEVADRLTVVVVGGPSGSGLDRPTALIELAGSLGIAGAVRFLPPLGGSDLVDLYHAADLVAVPSLIVRLVALRHRPPVRRGGRRRRRPGTARDGVGRAGRG
jgi:glycosyltransferase involved in cell wall biosynthesis